DETSGIDTIRYRQEGTTDWTEVQADSRGRIRFKLPINTQGKVEAQAIDRAGNEGDIVTSEAVQLEANKPEAKIMLNNTPTGSDNWYRKAETFKVSAKDDEGLQKVEIYMGTITDAVNPGEPEIITREETPLLSKTYVSTVESEPKVDAVKKEIFNDPAKLTTGNRQGDHLVIIAEVTDLAGNVEVATQPIKVESEAISITANYTYVQPGPSGGIVDYNGEMTGYPVTANIVTEPQSGISEILFAVKQNVDDGFNDADWKNISDLPKRVHSITNTEDKERYYSFKVVAKSGRTAQTDPQKVYINRQLPNSPELSVTLDNVDVNNKWVNELPEVTLKGEAYNGNDAAEREIKYGYFSKSWGVEIPKSDGSIEKVDETFRESYEVEDTAMTKAVQYQTKGLDGEYTVRAYTEDKLGNYSETPQKAEVRYDKTVPSEVNFNFKRENGRLYLEIEIVDNLSGGASLAYKIGENGEL
ncbi:MAG: hypothetical protein RR614_10930, partial [Eubacterium sp.]